jgi:hypothetical protein
MAVAVAMTGGLAAHIPRFLKSRENSAVRKCRVEICSTRLRRNEADSSNAAGNKKIFENKNNKYIPWQIMYMTQL